MIWLILNLCWLPIPVEAWPERKGEKKKSKVSDALWLTVYAIAVSLLGWKFVEPWKTATLILAFRISFYDYVIHALLKRYSENHKSINIWSYTGESTHWHDQLVAKIDWRLRIVIRVVLFAASLWWFLSTPT